MFLRALAFVVLPSTLLFTGCITSKPSNSSSSGRLSTKSVTFTIYTEHDYSDARWSDAKVQIRLAISRIRQVPYEQKTEFDTTLAWIEFQDLPETLRKMQIERKINSVDENKEAISISYAYTTSIDGYVMSSGKNDFIEKWEAKKEVNILF
jgi:hypothetical protein